MSDCTAESGILMAGSLSQWVSLASGVSLIVVALFIVFPLPMQSERPESLGRRGFIFGNSENLINENTSISMHFFAFDLDKRRSNVTIDINYVSQNRSSSVASFFVLQVPYRINNLRVVFGAWNPEFFGGNTSIVMPLEDLSYILIAVPKENQSFGQIEYMRLQFVIENAFRKKDHYTHSLHLEFANNFHDLVKNVEPGKVGNYYLDRLLYFKSKSAKLSIERPDLPYSVSELLPQPDEIGSWDSRTWHRWDIKHRSSALLSSSSVIVEILDESSKFWYDVRHSATWFLFGLGIPLVTSPLIFWFIERREWKNVETAVKKRMIQQLYTLFNILARFICDEQFTPVPSKEEVVQMLETFNRLEEAKLNEQAYYYYFPKPNNEMSFYQLDVLFRFKKYLSDLELKYFRLIKPKIRESLMAIQDHLSDIEYDFELVKKFSGSQAVVERAMPKSILAIMKEIYKLHKLGIEIELVKRT